MTTDGKFKQGFSEPLFELIVNRGWFNKQTLMYYTNQTNVVYLVLKEIEAILKDSSVKEINVKMFGHILASEKSVFEPPAEREKETGKQELEAISVPTCPECAAELTENALFCTECGASLSPATPTEAEAEESEEKKPPTILSITYDQDLAVYDYITQHGATISLSQAADDLGMTIEEVKKSIGRLKKSGKFEQA